MVGSTDTTTKGNLGRRVSLEKQDLMSLHKVHYTLQRRDVLAKSLIRQNVKINTRLYPNLYPELYLQNNMEKYYGSRY